MIELDGKNFEHEVLIKMASIPKAYIKKFVKKSFGANITDDGAATTGE